MINILLVDDDENLLTSFERHFRRNYTVLTSNSGKSALKRIQENTDISVVISDMNMPEMNGVEFLRQVKQINPLVTRIMLTGFADINVAMNAVNEGNIFRFLTKPVTPDVLEKVIADAVEQYRLITSEKQLLRFTLNGSLEILTEVLSMTNPAAFGRSSRIKKIVQHILSFENLDNAWQYELAATLCLIGDMSIPQPIQDKIHQKVELTPAERETVNFAPQVAYNLLCKIPRFEQIATMILNQHKPFHDYSIQEAGSEAALGSQMLRIAIDLDEMITDGQDQESITSKLILNEDQNYNSHLTVSLTDYFEDAKCYNSFALKVDDLTVGMVLDQDVFSHSGALLLVKGQEITEAVLPRIYNFQKYVGVLQPIKILIPPDNEALLKLHKEKSNP